MRAYVPDETHVDLLEHYFTINCVTCAVAHKSCFPIHCPQSFHVVGFKTIWQIKTTI